MTAPLLLPVDQLELRNAWATIRPALEELAELCGEGWLPEDVFHEIIARNAFLWAPEDSSGFIIFRIFETAYSRDLFVWLCWKDVGDPVRDYLPQIHGIAAENNCRRITFESPREGFVRALPGARRTYAYAIEVEE